MPNLTRIFALWILIHGLAASGADLAAVAGRAPDVTLDPVYHSYQIAPCRFYGFTLADPSGGLKQMQETGATIVGMSRWWSPVKDENALNGDGFSLDAGDETLWKTLDDLGMSGVIGIGDGVYPDWYYEKYSDFAMLDQEGKPLDKQLGRPVDHPQQMESCSAAVTAIIKSLKDRHVPMWVLGGEAFSQAYGMSDRWADYRADSVTHFREYCRMRYADIAKLNAAWGTEYAGFEAVEAPKTPKPGANWADWVDYRFRAMAERCAWLYQAVLKGDETRPALAADSVIMRDGQSAIRMAMMPDLIGSASDGFQIDRIDAVDWLDSVGKPLSLTGRPTDAVTLRRYAYESLGSGAWSLCLDQPKDASAVDEAKKVFSEFKTLEPYMQHMYPVKPKLGIYVSRYTWALEGLDSSLAGLDTGLTEHHVPKSFVYDDTDWSEYRVLLTIGNRIVSASAARKLRSYVESGGTLVIAGKLAESSDVLKPFDKPILAEKVQPMKVPGLNGWAAKIGKGMAIWLLDEPDASLADRIAVLMEDIDLAPPTKLDSTSVEAFTLTDGLNYVQVLINTSGESEVCQVTLDPDMLDPKMAYHVRDSITGKYFGRYAGDAVSYSIELAPHATAALLVMYDASKQEADKAVAAAEASARCWKGFDRQYAFTYADAATSALTAGKYAKALALASKVTSAFGISASVQDGDALQITARVLDGAGKPVGDADVCAVVTPAFGYTVKLSHIGGGKYAAKVSKESLGKMYDYKARKYVTFADPVVVDITAKRGHSIGAVRVLGEL